MGILPKEPVTKESPAPEAATPAPKEPLVDIGAFYQLDRDQKIIAWQKLTPEQRAFLKESATANPTARRTVSIIARNDDADDRPLNVNVTHLSRAVDLERLQS